MFKNIIIIVLVYLIIAVGCQTTLFNSINADASITHVGRAKKAGVLVFCMNREIDSSEDATSRLLSDNDSDYVTIGEYCVKTVGEEGKYIELLGIPDDNDYAIDPMDSILLSRAA